jgi:phospholipid-translocating ATPase
LENTLWQNTVLASSGYVTCQVVYTGKETRSEMNGKEANMKVGKLDLEVNRLSKWLFVFMVGIAMCIVAMDGFKGKWYINFFRFVLLLSAIIPISLRVNLDMAKVFYCYGIYHDQDMPGTIPRNSTIPEELGRIQYLLTDKTGTLTQNDMVFKKLAMEYAHFDLDNINELQQELTENCRLGTGPMCDLDPTNANNNQNQNPKSKRRDQ